MGSLVYGSADASGLLYRRNRYYDPVAGQFTQEDPIGLAGGLNLYGFADGDPVNFSDPFGLCTPFPQCLLQPGGFQQAFLAVANAFAQGLGLIDAATGGLGTDAVVVAEGVNPSTGESVGVGGRLLSAASLAGATGAGGFANKRFLNKLKIKKNRVSVDLERGGSGAFNVHVQLQGPDRAKILLGTADDLDALPRSVRRNRQVQDAIRSAFEMLEKINNE